MSQHVFKVSTTSMHTWPQMVTPPVNCSMDDVLVKVKPFASSVFAGRQCDKFLFHIHIAVTPQISKFKAHMMTLVHSDEAMIHLMQFSLVISHCKITSSVFWLSQDNVATLIRWGGWSSYCHMCHSFLWPSYGIGQAIIFLPCGFFSSSFFSSPNLSSSRLDV